MKKGTARKSKVGAAGSAQDRNSLAKRFLRWEVLLILAAFACDVNSWGHQFVLDDTSYIVENSFLQTPSNLFRIFVSPLVPVQLGMGHLYRPLTALSLGLNCWTSGLNPDGFHLVNRLLHVIVCLAIFWVLRSLLSNAWAAGITALLFAVHPIQTEAVTYINGRSDLLAMLFFVFAWLFHIRGRESDSANANRYFAAALVFYFFSMLSKESGVTWIAVILLTEYVYSAKCSPAALWQILRKGLWKILAGYLVPIALFLSLRAFALSKVVQQSTSFLDNPLGHVPFLERELTALKVLFQSIGLVVWPVRFSSDYSYNQIPLIAEWSSFAGLVVIALSTGLVFLLLWSHFRARNIFFGIGYLLATYSVVSNLIIPIGTIRADRLLYMPALGILMLSGTIFAAFGDKLQKPAHQKAFRVALAVLLLLLVVRTVQRNSDWQDPGTLWTKTVQTSPNSAKAHHSLGSIYFEKREYSLAIDQYRIAESIYPRNSELLWAFGTALQQVGNLGDAIGYYRRAVGLAPQYPMIRFSLAGALRAQGKLEEADAQEKAIIKFYDDLIRKNPSAAAHHYFKANALFHLGRLQESIAEYRQTLELDPNYSGARESIDVATRKLRGVR